MAHIRIPTGKAKKPIVRKQMSITTPIAVNTLFPILFITLILYLVIREMFFAFLPLFINRQTAFRYFNLANILSSLFKFHDVEIHKSVTESKSNVYSVYRLAL